MRGRDEWVRVSWDEALDLVHNQLKRVRDEHGSTGILPVLMVGLVVVHYMLLVRYYSVI